MLVQKIQPTANRIYKPAAKKTAAAAQKKLQQIILPSGMIAFAISNAVKADTVKFSGGASSCDGSIQYSIANPDLYSC